MVFWPWQTRQKQKRQAARPSLIPNSFNPILSNKGKIIWFTSGKKKYLKLGEPGFDVVLMWNNCLD
jgi:hypothetical protein